MPATATFDAHVAAPKTGFFDRLVERFMTFVENSPRARAADRFARLNALSDAELAARGLKRGDLCAMCFGYEGYV